MYVYPYREQREDQDYLPQDLKPKSEKAYRDEHELSSFGGIDKPATRETVSSISKDCSGSEKGIPYRDGVGIERGDPDKGPSEVLGEY